MSSSVVCFPSLCLSFSAQVVLLLQNSMQAVLVLLTSTCPLDWDCTVLQQCHPLDTLLEWVHASWSLPRCGYLHAQG